mgnify:CR=1 FL=1
MIKTFKFVYKTDLEHYFVDLKVDLSKFTKEVATQFNSFWVHAESRIKECNGDVFIAALRLYAAKCLELASFNYLIDASDMEKLFKEGRGSFDLEGFPPPSELGIEVTRVDNVMIWMDEMELVQDD